MTEAVILKDEPALPGGVRYQRSSQLEPLRKASRRTGPSTSDLKAKRKKNVPSRGQLARGEYRNGEWGGRGRRNQVLGEH